MNQVKEETKKQYQKKRAIPKEETKRAIHNRSQRTKTAHKGDGTVDVSRVTVTVTVTVTVEMVATVAV